jgi:hypothetical protein
LPVDSKLVVMERVAKIVHLIVYGF